MGSIIVGIIIAVLIITSIATYITAYDKLYEAAGVEAYGCANITTGLIDSNNVALMLKGDTSTMDAVGKQLNWTTAHKDIFESQYIIGKASQLLVRYLNFLESDLKQNYRDDMLYFD